jgi:methyl-accepting chemotaxis protein
MIFMFRNPIRRLTQAGRKVRVDAVQLADLQGQLAAINKSLAVVEFDLNGIICNANENFFKSSGYRLDEIKGQHHSILVDAATRASEEYRHFWKRLALGDCDSGQYKRLGKDGREVWMQGSYNPIFDAGGKPYKVVTFGTDVTAQVIRARQMQSTVAQTQNVVKSAIGGDLSKRVSTADASGDALNMAEAINFLLGSVSEMFADVHSVIMNATGGNLSDRVQTASKTGDLRKVAESVNLLLGSVSEIVANVKQASSEVLRGAEEISQGNLNLSQRTEQQSASLEETASSMEEMTSTVRQNADNAAEANQLAAAARDQAEQGGAVVGKAVGAMAKINEASTRIAAIIGVIDEIAFQTNLLALNAAVEAARAGEQGRGFAVVATEVRSLAGRSATAAKEIKELIQDSVQKVNDGSKLVTQSGQTLDHIVTAVKKVSDIVAQIAAASRQQSVGIEQVNKAILQMDEMTQQNAALVEEATAASRSMAAEARRLTTLIVRYDSGGSFEQLVPLPSAQQAEPAGVPDSDRRTADRPWAAKSTSATRSKATTKSTAATRARLAPKARAPAPRAAPAPGPGANQSPAPGSAAAAAATARGAPGNDSGAAGNDSGDAEWLEF